MLEFLLDLLGESFLNRASKANWSKKTQTIVDVLIGVLGTAAVIYGVWSGFLDGSFWKSVVLIFAGGLCFAVVIRQIVICHRKKERQSKE